MEFKLTAYILYISRWMVLAIPGAILLDMVLERCGFVRDVQIGRLRIKRIYPVMVLTQGVLGAAVFFVDRVIFSM